MDDEEGSYKSDSLPIFEEHISKYDKPSYQLSYVFSAKFNHGINVVKYKYSYNMSGCVQSGFGFSYILTEANRWANNGIEDFNLNIHLGKSRYMYLSSTFFEN